MKRFPLQPRRKVIHKRKLASYDVVTDARSAFFRPLLKHSLSQTIGSCTGNAPLTARLSQPYSLATLPVPWSTVTDVDEFQKLALAIYSGATQIDPFPGAWPPTDTGSDGASAMKVAVKMGLFDDYRAIETFSDLQIALQTAPCIFGSDWYTGMFNPDGGGQVSLTGVIEGGHEYAFSGIDVDRKLLWFGNSWDDDYGCKVEEHGGYFNMTYGTFVSLFNAGGAVECGVGPANDNALLPFRKAS